MHTNPAPELESQLPSVMPPVVVRQARKASSFDCAVCGDPAPFGFGMCRLCAEQDA